MFELKKENLLFFIINFILKTKLDKTTNFNNFAILINIP